MKAVTMMAIALIACSASAEKKPPLPGLLYKTGGLQWMSDGYGTRKNPMGGNAGSGYHAGEDDACRVGTRILALNAGEAVVCAYGDPVFGKYIVIRDALGFDVLYAHLSELWTPRGSHVVKGQTIGLTGATGSVTGPHIHVQVMMSPRRYEQLVQSAPAMSVCH